MGLVCFCSCSVAEGFVAIVKVSTAVDHVVGESVVALTCDCYIGVDVDSANLVAKVHESDTCPEPTIDGVLVCLVESAIHINTGQGLKLR